MTIAWMLATLLFSAALALAGIAAERVLRMLHRPLRGAWIAAMVAASAWPTLLLALRAIPASARTSVFRLPAIVILPGTSSIATITTTARSFDRVAVLVWALASAMMLVRLVRAVVLLRAARRACELRLVAGDPVLVSDALGPASFGVRRHDVILPRALLDLDAPLQSLVVRHEREHGFANDPAVLLGSAIALTLFPWNVALWWIDRRLRLAIELDCDERLLHAGVDPRRYGQLLLLLAQRRSLRLAPMLAAHPTHLERRILAMRTDRPRFTPMQHAAALIGLSLSLGVACTAGVSDGLVVGPRDAGAQRGQRPSAVAARAAVASGTYFEFQVDQTATQLPGTGMLRYPAEMRQANRQGEVLAQFVVGRDGIPDTASVKVLKSSDPAFTDAVRAGIATMRFTPARLHGAPVAQLVQQPFTFALSSK